MSELPKIRPTSDRKVRKYKTQQNCYGLLPGRDGSCPGATLGPGGCCWVKDGRKHEVCYVAGLMAIYKGVRPILEHNTKILKEADLQQKQQILEAEFQRFYDAEMKREKRTGEPAWLLYRLHWSGDFFDAEYAQAAAAAMKKFPMIKFWVYTRSMFAVPILADVSNLVVYISLDPVNMVEGLDTFYTWKKNAKHENVQICYLSPTPVNDFEAQWAMARGLTANPHLWEGEETPIMATCPVDVGRLPLEGGCATCQKCLGTRRGLPPIWFKP